MKVIQRGFIADVKFTGQCDVCASVVEYNMYECQFTDNNPQNGWESVNQCPVCGKLRIKVYSEK